MSARKSFTQIAYLSCFIKMLASVTLSIPCRPSVLSRVPSTRNPAQSRTLSALADYGPIRGRFFSFLWKNCLYNVLIIIIFFYYYYFFVLIILGGGVSRKLLFNAIFLKPRPTFEEEEQTNPKEGVRGDQVCPVSAAVRSLAVRSIWFGFDFCHMWVELVGFLLC